MRLLLRQAFPIWPSSTTITSMGAQNDEFLMTERYAPATLLQSRLSPDEKGGLRAGEEEGVYLVEVKAGEFSAQATFTIAMEDTPPPPPTPPPPEIRKMRWTGEVPPQKWMNFYTKVLSRYATGANLKLNVGFEVITEEGLPPHRIEETKALLRELGLDDEVEASE